MLLSEHLFINVYLFHIVAQLEHVIESSLGTVPASQLVQPTTHITISNPFLPCLQICINLKITLFNLSYAFSLFPSLSLFNSLSIYLSLYISIYLLSISLSLSLSYHQINDEYTTLSNYRSISRPCVLFNGRVELGRIVRCSFPSFH